MTSRQYKILSQLAAMTPFFSVEDRNFIRRVWYVRSHHETCVLDKERRERLMEIKKKYLPVINNVLPRISPVIKTLPLENKDGDKYS